MNKVLLLFSVLFISACSSKDSPITIEYTKDIIPNSTKIVYGIAIAGQSNASGLAPIKELTNIKKGPFNKVLIWNDKVNSTQPLEIGVNEAGLNGGLSGLSGTRPDSAVFPSVLNDYHDGFAFEQGFAESWQRNKADTIYYFKKNVETITSTDGSSIAIWQSKLFGLYAAEFNRMKAKLSSDNKHLIVNYLLWNQGEADANNDDYVADLNGLMARFKVLFNNPDLKIIIVKTEGASNQYSNISKLQEKYVSQEPSAILLTIPNHSYLPDKVHTSANSMREGGRILFELITKQ